MSLQVLYRDAFVVALYKPAGWLVHRTALDSRVPNARIVMPTIRDQLNQYVYPVHRLDRPTAGILLLALHAQIAKRLSQQFESRSIDKEYLAVVRGHPTAHGVIDYPLLERLDPTTDALARPDKQPQDATTEFRTVARVEHAIAVRPYQTSRYALVALRPRTGRKHQLRRHLKHIFHPVVGDTTYGDGKHNQSAREHFNCRRMLLLANRLSFNHPETGERLAITTPGDGEFMAILRAMALMPDGPEGDAASSTATG
ncbi:MAG: pseudouridine synthase [Pseudomonadota bacterium]